MKQKSKWRFIVGVIILVIFLTLLVLFWDYVVAFCSKYTNTGVWDLISLLATVTTVGLAALSTIQAKKAIEISNDEYINGQRPVLLYSELKNKHLDTFTKENECRINLLFCNHGQGVALLREIESCEKSIAIYILPPISVGVGETTDIVIIHETQYVTDLIHEYRNYQNGLYKNTIWNIEVSEQKIGEEKLKNIKLSRPVKFNLVYWNIFGDCYKNEIEVEISINYNIHMFADCFLNSEIFYDYKEGKNSMPNSISNYSSHEKDCSSQLTS